MFKKILVPLDGSALSETAIPLVRRLLEGTPAEITLFAVDEAPHETVRRRRGLRSPVLVSVTPGAAATVPLVFEPGPPAYLETRDQAIERREHELIEYLIGVGQPLAAAGCAVQAAVHFGDPAREIIAFARRGRFDLIAMATHGRSGLRQTLQGSVAAEVVRSGVAPVLVVRPRNARRRRNG